MAVQAGPVALVSSTRAPPTPFGQTPANRVVGSLAFLPPDVRSGSPSGVSSTTSHVFTFWLRFSTFEPGIREFRIILS